MKTKPINTENTLPRWYRGADIPMRVIRQYIGEVVRAFQPEQVVLFGSYAGGRPHEDSDVDLLVVMPARNELDQAVRIRNTVAAPFPLDLLVRKPASLNERLADGEAFTTEIMMHGKLMYDQKKSRVGKKGRVRLSSRPPARSRQTSSS